MEFEKNACRNHILHPTGRVRHCCILLNKRCRILNYVFPWVECRTLRLCRTDYIKSFILDLERLTRQQALLLQQQQRNRDSGFQLSSAHAIKDRRNDRIEMPIYGS